MKSSWAFLFLLTSNVFSGVLDFRDYTLLSYGSNQDLTGTAVVADNGATLHLTGNVWKCIAYNYLIRPDTVLEFDFQSDLQGEEHSIGLDKDLGNTPDNRFKLYGTQSGGAALLDYNDYLSYAPQTCHYKIPIGQYYTGSMQYLFFVNDHDAGSMNGQSRFTNVNIYEKELPPGPSPDPMTWQISPHPTANRSIAMTATTAYDPDGVEYYFECLSGDERDSGWQDSPVYVATDLRLNTEYVFTVKARDKSPDKNETAPSLPASVVTPSLVILEDFEAYYGNSRYADNPLDGNHLLADNWKDGTTNATGSVILPYPVGYLEVIYDNSSPPHYSTIQRQWETSQNWKIEDVHVLSFLFKGDPNVPSLDVRLYDVNCFTEHKITDTYKLRQEKWYRLDLDLNLFAGLDFASITKLEIGIACEKEQAAGRGTIGIDDIRLSRFDCTSFPDPADIDRDCIVDANDLLILSRQWLNSGYDVTASSGHTSNLIARYDMNESNGMIVSDTSGNSYHADVITTERTSSVWDPAGRDNGCISMDGTFYLEIPASVFENVDNQLTVSLWMSANRTLWPDEQELIVFEAGYPTKDRLESPTDRSTHVSNEWNHYAFVKDADAGVMRIYENGLFWRQNGFRKIIDN